MYRILLGEQTMSEDEDAVILQSGSSPFDIMIQCRYGSDLPFVNELIARRENFKDAYDIWSIWKPDISEMFMIKQRFEMAYSSGIDCSENISIEIIMIDGDNCEIASSVYECIVDRLPDLPHTIQWA